ncbi:MAG: M55 family metallopeptidase [Bacteroides sp.]|nr:M55 family metallopeptidase [Bacteroides sp.]
MKQLIIIADMEGASGIFERNREAMRHEEVFPENTLWRSYGRSCITSDVLAVCRAAMDFGIDEIMLYDMHFAGCAEHNVILEELPRVKVFDLPDRCCYWSRIRGQAALEPFGIVTVGQHARNGEPDAYFPHTIHTPPIEALYVNGRNISETGEGVMCFEGTPYIANIGCAASHKEARELSPNVSCISVKDKSRSWEPAPEETYPIIYSGVSEALRDYENKTPCVVGPNVQCLMTLTEEYYYDAPKNFPWKGSFEKRKALWEAPDIEAALGLYNYVHQYIKKLTTDN